MKKRSAPGRPRTPASAADDALRTLKKCLRELRALLIEAGSILDHLLLNPSAAIIRRLCSRYYDLQEYFVLRYAEARSCAVAALGTVQAALFFPI